MQAAPSAAAQSTEEDDAYECPSVIHASGKPGYALKYHQAVRCGCAVPARRLRRTR